MEKVIINFCPTGMFPLKTVNSLAISFGYAVKIGLEDIIWWDTKKTEKAFNLDLLGRVHKMMDIHEVELFHSDEFVALGFCNTICRNIT